MDKNGESRLSALDDDGATTGFANLVTSVNCKGASSNFDYVQFGIVFYDFEVVPVAANNLQYIHGALKVDESDAGDHASEVSNSQQQSAVHSAELGSSVTETTSVSSSVKAVKVVSTAAVAAQAASPAAQPAPSGSPSSLMAARIG